MSDAAKCGGCNPFIIHKEKEDRILEHGPDASTKGATAPNM